jgi:hypothetical protein
MNHFITLDLSTNVRSAANGGVWQLSWQRQCHESMAEPPKKGSSRIPDVCNFAPQYIDSFVRTR